MQQFNAYSFLFCAYRTFISAIKKRRLYNKNSKFRTGLILEIRLIILDKKVG